MRKLLLYFAFALLLVPVGIAQNRGDIAFVGFNADGDDDFAIVALADIAANTTIYFTDNEVSSGGGLADTNEGIIQWDTGTAIITAGTIVIFTDTDAAGNPNFGASVGTLTMPDPSLNLSGGGDALFAYLGTDPSTPTLFLAGIQNEANNTGDLAASGLTEGTDFVTFTSGSNDDGGVYNASRDDQTSFAAYGAIINTASNWSTQSSNGELLLPFSTTPFTTALPVELTSFEAIASTDAVTLTWTTASETNNAGFELQQATAGAAFTPATFVSGQGTTLQAQSYQHTIANLIPGQYRFRLKQVDYDGAFEYSSEVEVTVGVEHSFQLSEAYPNPFNPETVFSVSVQSDQRVEVAVYNLLGQRVRQLYAGTVTAGAAQRVVFDAGGLPGGVYLIQARGAEVMQSRTVTLLK